MAALLVILLFMEGVSKLFELGSKLAFIFFETVHIGNHINVGF